MYNYHRIRDLREDIDKSQEKLANELNMHTTTYARYETGENRVPFDFAITLSNYYNVSLDYIAGRTNDKKGFNKSDLPNPEIEILKKIRSLSIERKSRLLERLDMLSEEQEQENAKIKGAV